jgi:hypothetical protein
VVVVVLWFAITVVALGVAVDFLDVLARVRNLLACGSGGVAG